VLRSFSRLRNRHVGNTMAESKGALIAKTVQKHAGRAKEKVSISIDPPLSPLSLSLPPLSLSLSLSLFLSLSQRRLSSRLLHARDIAPSRFSFAISLNINEKRMGRIVHNLRNDARCDASSDAMRRDTRQRQHQCFSETRR